MGNCSFENLQIRTFSLLALLLTRFLSSAKTRPQCSFNTCNSLKASSPEFKRRNIAVSCLSTLSRFALDAISNKKNMRNTTHNFRALPNSRLAFVDTMVDTRLRNKIKASVSECIRSQKIQPFDRLDTLQCIQKLLYLVTSNRGPYN